MIITAAIETELDWPRSETQIDYCGRMFILCPRSDVSAQTVSTKFDKAIDLWDGLLIINRFLTALAWSKNRPIRVLTVMGSGHDVPVNLDIVKNTERYATEFSVDYLPRVSDPKAQLALALYREALCVNSVPYAFLGFAKVLNVFLAGDVKTIKWINENLANVNGILERARIVQLQQEGTDIGKYLYVNGRCAVAHAYSDPLVDPDIPNDERRLLRDLPLIQSLAQLLIESELCIKTEKTWLSEEVSR